MSNDLRKALEDDGAKLRALTGEEHGPVFIDDVCPWDDCLYPDCCRANFCNHLGDKDPAATVARIDAADRARSGVVQKS